MCTLSRSDVLHNNKQEKTLLHVVQCTIWITCCNNFQLNESEVGCNRQTFAVISKLARIKLLCDGYPWETHASFEIFSWSERWKLPIAVIRKAPPCRWFQHAAARPFGESDNINKISFAFTESDVATRRIHNPTCCIVRSTLYERSPSTWPCIARRMWISS